MSSGRSRVKRAKASIVSQAGVSGGVEQGNTIPLKTPVWRDRDMEQKEVCFFRILITSQHGQQLDTAPTERILMLSLRRLPVASEAAGGARHERYKLWTLTRR